MSSTEKRSVATDALETLGTKPIPDNSGRDAIHLAVEPVVAGTTIFPGQHINIENGLAGPSESPIGIADPFMASPAKQGERFWLVVYPREITSLRHVWSHPSFPDEATQTSARSDSEKWLIKYAEEIDEDFDTLIDAAKNFLRTGDLFYGRQEHGYYGKFEGQPTHHDFWDHFEDYTGQLVPEDRGSSFFPCSC